MNELQVIERLLATLSSTPAGIIILIIVLVVAAGMFGVIPMLVYRYLSRTIKGLTDSQKHDDGVTTSILDILTKNLVKLEEQSRLQTEQVTLATQAIQQATASNKAIEAAVSQMDINADGRQTIILDRLDVLENLVAETIKDFVERITEHDARAGERARVLATTMESRFGELLGELRTIRDSIVPAPMPRPIE